MKKLITKLLRLFGYKLIKVSPKATNFLYEYIPNKEILYLNVGAGRWSHPYWNNLDNPRTDYAKSLHSDISFDLTSGAAWPIKDDSLNIVYTSHTIEHLNDKFVLDMMKQAYKKLKPEGVFRLTCPDIDIFLDSYKRKDEYFFKISNFIVPINFQTCKIFFMKYHVWMFTNYFHRIIKIIFAVNS